MIAAVDTYSPDATDAQKRELITKLAGKGSDSPLLMRLFEADPSPQARERAYTATGKAARIVFRDKQLSGDDMAAAEQCARAFEALDQDLLTVQIAILNLTHRLTAEINTLTKKPRRDGMETDKLFRLLFAAGRRAEARALVESDRSPSYADLSTVLAVIDGDFAGLLTRIGPSAPDNGHDAASPGAAVAMRIGGDFAGAADR